MSYQYPSVIEGGEERLLSLHPREEALNGHFAEGAIPCSAGVIPAYGITDDCPIIPREQWAVQESRKHLITRILDQDGLNYCHSFAGAQTLMGTRNAAGMIDTELSAVCLGSQVTGGRNSGAALSDVLPVLLDSGTVPALLISNSSANMSQRNWPSGWKEAASDYVVLEAYDIAQSNVFAKASSALQRGFFVAFGMDWGRGGHALCAVDLVQVGGEWGWHGVGSWGPKAHDGDGWWTFAESKMFGLNKYGCFAIRVAKRAKVDPVPPALKL